MQYGRLVNGVIEYFKPHRGGIKVGSKIVYTSSEKIYNKYGWYRVEVVADDKPDTQVGSTIYHYIGASEQLSKGDETLTE